MRSDRLLDAVELDDDQALGEAGLVGLGGIAAGEEAAAGGGDRRSRELRIGRQCIRIRNRTIARHPIRLCHCALRRLRPLRAGSGQTYRIGRGLTAGLCRGRSASTAGLSAPIFTCGRAAAPQESAWPTSAWWSGTIRVARSATPASIASATS